MASKVNVKFVVILSAAIVGVLVALAFLGAMVMYSPPDKLARQADAAVAAGRLDDAEILISKAVNKEKTNTEYLGKWRDVIRKLAPEEQVKYTEKLRGLQGALRQIAVVQRDNVEAQREFLDLLKRQVLDAPYQRESSDFMVTEANTFIAFHATKPAGPWEVLRRYRGLAQARIVAAAPDAVEDMGTKAAEDLTAALRADPADLESALTLQDLYGVLAAQAERSGKPDERKRFEDLTLAVSETFTKANAASPAAVLQDLRREFDSAIRAARQTGADPRAAAIEFQGRAKPKLDEAVELMRKDPGTVTVRVLDMLRSLEQLIDSGARLSRSLEASTLASQKRPNDVDLAIVRADLLATRDDLPGAVSELSRVVDMKLPTISVEGSRLFGQRIQARFLKALFTVRAWQRAEADKKPALVEQAKAFRAEMAKVEGTDSPRMILIDGWLAFLDEKYQQANDFISRYNRMSQGADPDALMLGAQVAMRLALPGQARERLQEVLKLQPGNLAAQITLGDVELQLENLDQAEEIYKRLAETLPDNKAVQERVAAMQALRGTGTAANPVQQAILTSERMKNEAKDQTAAAEQIVKYLEAQWKQIGPDPTLTIALARARMNFNQKDQALADVRTSLKANPDNKNLKQLEAALAAPDELSAKIAVIEMQRGSAAEFEIEWALYLAYDTHGKKAEADAAFAKAAALSPDEPRVLETQFVRALNAKDMATANQIADKAAKGNVDEVGGASFKARSLATEGRVNDAITVMREVVSRPAPSPESWRLLGRLQNLAGRSGDSVDSFRQALKLRPTDVQAINELVGTLAMTNRREEALAQARQSVRYAESDEAFFRLWMQLEGELGDRKMVVERRQRMRVAQPSDRENLVALARAMMDVGQLPEAREVIDTVGATAKDIDWVQVEAAWRWTSNDQTGAVMVFDEYLKSLEPQSAPAYLVFAQFLNERNDINGCIEVLTRARPLQDPKQMEVDRILSDVLFRAGRFAECVQGLEAILAANADDEGQNFRKRLAEVYVLLREWDKSEKALEGVTNRDNDVAVTLLSAEVAGGKGDAKGQRDTLDRAVVKFSGDARVFFKRGQLLMAQDPKSKDALADFSRALQLQPNLWQAYRLRAAIHANNNDIEGALADLRATIRLNPSDSRLVGGLIGDLIRMNRDQEAEVVGDEAMRGRPRDASLAYGIAETFFGAQRLAPARRFFKTAFDLDRQDAVAQRYLDALLVSENPSATEAERVLGLLGERVPKNAGFMMSAARVRMLQQKRQEAGQMAVAALRSVDPANFQAMMNWSVDMKDVLPDAGQRRTFYENAISQGVVPGATEWLAFFRARIDLDTESTREQGLRTLREILVSSKNAPLRAATYRTIGGQLYLISRYQESIDAMKPGLEEFPEDLELLNNTAFMLSKKLGKPADAMPFAERAAKLAPTSGEVLDTLGVTLLALNRPAEAEVQLRQAIAGASSAASQLTIAVHLVDALLTQNKTEEARQIMTAAQKLVDEVLKTEADPESVAELQKLRTKAGM